MLKKAFQDELSLSAPLQRNSQGNDVRRVQEWLSLSALRFPEASVATNVDGQFGPATERAVRNFEEAVGRTPTGVVTPDLFDELSHPLAAAFQKVTPVENIRQTVVQVAQRHLKQRATELQSGSAQNLGPWVRSYCDGLDGSPFKWCMGFVQTVLDQVAAGQGRQFTAIMPKTLSCDVLALSGRQTGRLTENTLIRRDPSRIKPGDVFLLRFQGVDDWFHTGVITRVDDDVVETIEGNTDTKGSSNGTGVFARVRNFRKTTMDVFSIEGL